MECAELSVDEVLRLADRGLYLAKQRGRNRAVGLIPSTSKPSRPGNYSRLEQLLEDDMVREIPTFGDRAAVAGSDLTSQIAELFPSCFRNSWCRRAKSPGQTASRHQETLWEKEL